MIQISVKFEVNQTTLIMDTNKFSNGIRAREIKVAYIEQGRMNK